MKKLSISHISRSFLIYISILITVICVVVVMQVYPILFRSADKPPELVTSDSFPTIEEKVSKLKETSIIDILTPVEDISYIINYSHASFGPSTGEYRIAIKLKPDYVNKWLYPGGKFTIKSHSDEIDYQKDMRPLTISWKYTSSPEFYSSLEGYYCVVYRREGIIIFIIKN